MKIGALGFGLGCLFLLVWAAPIEAFPPDDAVYCRVVYVSPAPGESTEYNGDRVSVKISGLSTLPTNPSFKGFAVSSDPLPIANYQGTIRDETDKEIITYTGHFTDTKAMEHFEPDGNPIVLRPENWLPATGKEEPEIYTSENHGGLRAVWLRTPIYGGNIPPVEQRYFAVSVQLYNYLFKPVSCRFTGTRTTKTKSFWGKSSTENLTDAEIKFVNASDRKISVYPRASAVRM